MRNIKYYANKKNELMRAAKQTNNPKAKEEYLTAFDLCDRMIADLDKYYKICARKLLILVVIVNLAVIGTILSGCETFRGMKADVHWLTADVEHVSKPYIVDKGE